MSAWGPNRVSVLTPPGRGAIAVIAASGPQACIAIDASFQAANGRRLSSQTHDRIVFGHWASSAYREEVILVRGHDDALEIHCHGGAAAVARIVDVLTAAGCEQLSWTDWLESKGADQIVLEADVALAHATTRRAAAILLDQRNGALARALGEVRTSLQRSDAASAQQTLNELLERSTLGLHLTNPWQVAIAGRPNVGKSSLINALVGYQRAIVFDQPGTTRDVLAADTAIDGWPVRLTDAAGIRATDDPLESAGVVRAREQLRRADLVLWVMDATTLTTAANAVDIAQREFLDAGVTASDRQPLVVVNKIDLFAGQNLQTDESMIAVSALTGAGLDGLLAEISKRLVPEEPEPGAAIPFTPRHVELLQRALASAKSGDFRAAVSCVGLLSGDVARL
jgi:tRNA modification GTPase